MHYDYIIVMLNPLPAFPYVLSIIRPVVLLLSSSTSNETRKRFTYCMGFCCSGLHFIFVTALFFLFVEYFGFVRAYKV